MNIPCSVGAKATRRQKTASHRLLETEIFGHQVQDKVIEEVKKKSFYISHNLMAIKRSNKSMELET
jgi:hypothetical protein